MNENWKTFDKFTLNGNDENDTATFYDYSYSFEKMRN